MELQQSVFARVAVDYAEVELVQEAKYYPPKTDLSAVAVEFHPMSVSVNSFHQIVPESQAHSSSSYHPPEEPPRSPLQ